jgi:hypothetical protein
MSRLRPTPEIEKAVAAFIRAGGYPHVAAEAAGVPRETFDDWLRRGRSPRAHAAYRRFAEAVRQAHAHARLTAEIAALKNKPLDWLRNGPGKETPASPGWTSAVKPASAPAGFAEAELHDLIRALLDVLGPYPEARAAVAAALTDRPAGTAGR